MAQQQQAARLASRMQRELKMLTSDPPPGVCAWPLHNHLLTHLQAQIQGPQGTVYAGGIFKLDIEVPERYPFEPPSIKFLTPVYHPNVDNGGRICLDILNSPPKGAWRPSLNLSTLLASIGLLLAEPNPDDGLMVDITSEYKHDKPTFDAKARRWTELYATNDKLKQTETLNDIQESESFKEKGFSLEEPHNLKKDNLKMNVIGEQENAVRANLPNGTACFRKKLSLQGDVKGEVSVVPMKRNYYPDKRKLSVQLDSKNKISILSPEITDRKEKNLALQEEPKKVSSAHPFKDIDSQEQNKMMRTAKENQPPNKPSNSISLASKINCTNASPVPNDNLMISDPHLMETFSEGIPVNTRDVPSRSKSFKLSRTRLDIYVPKMEETNVPKCSENTFLHLGKALQCSEEVLIRNEINGHVVVGDAQTVFPVLDDSGLDIDSSDMQHMISKSKTRNYDADVPTIVVSDSGSDDELSDENFALSLTQRSFKCKRKANSKLR